MFKVSIIIPTFNRAVLLDETLQTVLEQTYLNWECIIVDDGSDEDTLDTIKDWCKKDNRFQWYKRPLNKQKGANACRNIGIEKSTGNYLIFLDSDDNIIPTCIENRISHATSSPETDGFIFSMVAIQGKGSVKNILNNDPDEGTSGKAYAKKFLTYEIPFQTSNVLWKSKVFEVHEGFDENLSRFQDVDLHTKLLLSGIRMSRIYEIDFHYRVEEGLEKYNDDAFIHKASSAVLYYIEKYLASNVNYIIDDEERRKCLKKMFVKFLGKFVYAKNRKDIFKNFILFAKEKQLFSTREQFYLRLLYLLDRYQLEEKKGFGFYRISKFVRKQVFN